MADMTDTAFCRIAKRFGAKIVFREMVSAEAVIRGNEKTLGMTAFDEEERPIVQQLFGADPAVMAEAARIIYEQFKPDAFDINMGCPVYKIVSNFNGAALMNEPKIAAEIIKRMKDAVPVPVSVKIRLGWSDPTQCQEFAPVLEAAGAALLTVHGRTKTQGYSGIADWNAVGEVKKRVKIPVLCNGDIHTPDKAAPALAASGCDGVLIARGALGNPWILKQMEEALKYGEVRTHIDDATRMKTVLEHAKLMLEAEGERGIILMRKHLTWYYKNKQMREKLTKVSTYEELEAALSAMLQPA